MTPERWRQVQSLLDVALAIPLDERSRYVAGVCAGDADLLQEVESLLAQASHASGFLSTPAFRVGELSSANDVSLVGRTIGTFTIKSRLGSGGMGDVYLADDASLRRPVAVKALREDGPPTPDGRERLLREARAAAALNHANITTIFHVLDSVDAATPPLMVMEYVEGETLSDRLKRGRLPAGDALRLGRDVAEALAEAHAHGIIHRDLKPANLRLTREGRVKVLDFGLARRIAQPADATTAQSAVQLHPGLAAGTPGYISPEQTIGRGAAPPADIFSLGVVLFEMIAGQRPFPGDDFVDIAAAMMTGAAPHLTEFVPDLDPAVDVLVERMLDREASRRPSPADVVAELSQLLRPAAAPMSLWRRTAAPAAVLLALAASAIVAREPLR